MQHQIQLVALGSSVLLEVLKIVLQFLMHHGKLLSVQAVEGIKGVLLRRLLAGGMVMMMLMMMLKYGREILPFRVVTSATLVGSRPGVLVSRGGRTRQPTGTRA